MGTSYTVELAAPIDDAARTRLAQLIDAELVAINRSMSTYDPGSEVSEFNRREDLGWAPASPGLLEVLASASRISTANQGAFDVTVGPLMKAWGFFNGDGRVPTDTELRDVMRRVGYQHVVLDRSSRTIRFDVAGVEIDLGGIAKGYAVDRVVALLRQDGITAAVVSAGGSTVYGLGHPPDRASWEVRIQDPLNSSNVAFTVGLANRALSMAGRSAKTFERNGVLYSHIMDPRTGRPVQGVVAVAVTSETGTEGDALDDALFVMGMEKSRGYLRRFRGTNAWIWLSDPRRSVRFVQLQ